MLRTFVNCERADQRPVSNARKPSRFLFLRATKAQRAGSHQRRADQRRSGEGAPELLNDESHALVTEITASEFFRHDDSSPSHLTHFGVEAGIEAGPIRAFEQGTVGGYRRILARPVARHVLEHLLFFGQHCHAPVPLSDRSTTAHCSGRFSTRLAVTLFWIS